MDENLLKQAKKLAARNYKLIVFEDKLTNGKIIYMAKNPELKGCMAQGTTIEDAIKNLADARVDYIYDSLEDDIAIPDPAPLAVQTAFTIDSEQLTINKSISFSETLEGVAQPSHRKQLYEAWIRP